jgi:pimeloyl-ACP methyl ester carboxylesterase
MPLQRRGRNYVLVPGAGGSAWYWHRLEPELRQRGHDVVAVDLPADDDNAGLAEYAEAIVRAAGRRTNIVLVAQSMAGFSAPLVCGRIPVSLIVLLNAMIPKPGETAGDWWANTGQARAKSEKDVRDGRPADAEFDVFLYFLHDLPQDVVDASAEHNQAQSETPFGEPWPLDAWPDVPTRVVVASDDRFFPAEFQRRVAQERLGITPVEIPGGHLVALSRPKELADLLEALSSETEHASSEGE